jgi:flavine halogenase
VCLDTEFSATLGAGGYSWNVIRSESDELLFRHAAKSGAQVFDGTKVEALTFEPVPDSGDGWLPEDHLANPGRLVRAAWSRKNGEQWEISFDYVVDASGRNGLICTKYLKTRRFNAGLKNIANWAYWKGYRKFNAGEDREDSPFFEALQGKRPRG